jgi:hypothetical protein
MKYLLLIVVCLLASSFILINDPQQKPMVKTTIQYEYLTPGNYTDVAEPELFYKTVTQFNEAGKITSQLIYNMRQKDSLVQSLVYSYDNQGRLLVIKNKGIVYQEIRYEQDKNNNLLTTSRFQGKKNSVRIKNANANVDTVWVFAPDESLLYKLVQIFNAGHDTIRQLKYDDKGAFDHKEILVIDKENGLVNEIIFDKDGNRQSHETITYKPDGQVRIDSNKRFVGGLPGVLIDNDVYQYTIKYDKLDKYGNWLQSSRLDGNKYILLNRREIVYY